MYLNDGAWVIGEMQRSNTRFGAAIERFTLIWHLNMVKIFREADEISWPVMKQSLRHSSSKGKFLFEETHRHPCPDRPAPPLRLSSTACCALRHRRLKITKPAMIPCQASGRNASMERVVRELWAESRVLLGLHSSSPDEAPVVTRADLPLTPLAFFCDHVSPGRPRGG
jgi:hypothetical protein